MKRFYLREIAHARAGDKGDASNIGVIAYVPQDYGILREQVTVASTVTGRVRISAP